VSDGSQQPEGQGPPAYQNTTWMVLAVGVVLVVGLMSVRTDFQPNSSRDYPSRAILPDVAAVLLPPPEINDEFFPCSDCHEDETPDPEIRELEDEHNDKKLAHGDLWCLRCHDLNDRDSLHLADGALVAFEESWKLCTQCHGNKLAEWRAGVHGKRVGHWRGPKEYWNCVACHDPHSPVFKKLEPKPPPHRPTEATAKHAASEES